MTTVLDALAVFSAGGLAAAWLLYPGAMRLLSRVLPARSRQVHGYQPTVTVVIATRADEASVRARVDNCLASTYPPELLDVVVAYDRRHGERRPLNNAAWNGRVSFVPGDDPGGKAAALNAGVRAARGDVLVFADTHQAFLDDTIPRLIAALSDPRTGAVSGSLRLPEGTPALVARYWQFERRLRRAEARLHSSVGVTGAVYAMRKSLWDPLPPSLLLDDVYTPMRVVLAGYRVGFEEDARAIETRKPNPAQEYGRKVRTQTGVLQLCAWLPAVLLPVRNPIWFQFVFHKLARLLTPYCLMLIAAWMLVRGAAALGGFALVAAALSLLMGFWLARTHTQIGGRIRRAVIEGALIQFAVIVAGFNGLRGRWQVWDA